LGIRQSPRGARVVSARPDYIVCDDTDTEAMAKNPAIIKETVEWIEGALIGTMDNKNERFIFANNRISEKGILAGLQKNHSDWKTSRVDALDKHGKVTWSAKYSKDYFTRKLQNMGMRAYQREYMNKPSVSAGVFKEDLLVFKKPLENWADYDALVMYCDPSFSTSITSDFTAIKLWGIKGKDLICLKSYCRQDESIEKALKWWQKYLDSLSISVRLKIKCFIESNATQRILVQNALDKLDRFVGIQFDKDYKGDKADRIAAMIPAYEQGLVSYSLYEKSDPDMLTAIQMLLEWTEKGSSHDDSPDADAGAWSKLQVKPRPQSVAGHSILKRYR
jgi:phage terminase large subunit-like protein